MAGWKGEDERNNFFFLCYTQMQVSLEKTREINFFIFYFLFFL